MFYSYDGNRLLFRCDDDSEWQVLMYGVFKLVCEFGQTFIYKDDVYICLLAGSVIHV